MDFRSAANEQLDQQTERSRVVNTGTHLVADEIARPSALSVNYDPTCTQLLGDTDENNLRRISTEGFKKRRLVSKSGELKVLAKNVPRKTRLYLADIFTTMVDLRWKWVIVIFMTSYIFSWTLFGFIWWLIALLRGSSTCVSKVG